MCLTSQYPAIHVRTLNDEIMKLIGLFVVELMIFENNEIEDSTKLALERFESKPLKYNSFGSFTAPLIAGDVGSF